MSEAKKELNKLTIEDILKRKKFFEEKKQETKELYIKSLDSTITIKKPSKELLIDCLSMEDEGDGDTYLVYESIVSPDLHSKELRDAFADQIKEPTDIVDILFDYMEVRDISIELINMSGNGGVKPVDEIVDNLKK